MVSPFDPYQSSRVIIEKIGDFMEQIIEYSYLML